MPTWWHPRAGLLAACPSTLRKCPSAAWPFCLTTSPSRLAHHNGSQQDTCAPLLHASTACMWQLFVPFLSRDRLCLMKLMMPEHLGLCLTVCLSVCICPSVCLSICCLFCTIMHLSIRLPRCACLALCLFLEHIQHVSTSVCPGIYLHQAINTLRAYAQIIMTFKMATLGPHDQLWLRD